MEYNKRQFRKTSDNKVLHKVKKHWVVMSMAILGMIGATGAVKGNVHASSVDTNHSVTINPQSSHKKTINPLLKRTNSTSQLRQRIDQSVQQLSSKQILHRANQIGVKAIQTGVHPSLHSSSNSTPIGRTIASDSKQVRQPTVNQAQVNRALNAAQQTDRKKQKLTAIAEANLAKLDAQNNKVSSHSMGVTDINTVLNNIKNDYINTGHYYRQLVSNRSAAESAYNIAHADTDRYYEPIYAPNNGGASASADMQQASSEVNSVPLKAGITNSITATYVSNVASVIHDRITEGQGTQQYASQANSLAAELSQINTSLSNETTVASSLAQDASANASNADQAVSMASVKASEAATNASNTTDAIVNVTNGEEVRDATFNGNVL